MPEPWLKLDTSVTSNPKVMGLSGDTFKCWVCLLCETKLYAHDDIVPPLPRLAFALHVSLDRLRPHITALHEARLIDGDEEVGYRVHDWDDWQRAYPSDSKEARAERQRRSRVARKGQETGGLDLNTEDKVPKTGVYPLANVVSQDVTTGHAVTVDTNGVTPVTSGRESHVVRLDKTRLDETRLEEGAPPPVTPTLRRGSRIPADFPLTDELVKHAVSLGIADRDVLERWHDDYHNFWLQRATKATSLDWVKHAKSRMSADVREGRLRPPVLAKTAPSRAQEPVVTGVPELTPAEETYEEFLRVSTGEVARDEASEVTRSVVDTLGGWDRFQGDDKRAPPRFPEWVGAFQRSQGRFPGAD